MTGALEVSAARTGWHDGYVVDVPYIEPLTTDLCPAAISMACVLAGQPPLPSDRPLVWAELGSGGGLAAVTVAALNDVEVWGCDFNPAHVERARDLARRADLDNCTFDEASFAEVAADDSIGPPEVDVVVVHGVYSWISPANQRRIVEFVRRRLRPGGVVYVSYEVPTGWASMAPISEAMRLHVEADGRRSDVAFPDAVAAIQRLADGGARCFPLGANERWQLGRLPNVDVRYAVHEYLTAHFGPLMLDEVVETFAAAKCTHIGSASPVDHVRPLWLPEALQPTVDGLDDPVLQAMVGDLATQRALRRDLYRRGVAVRSTVQHDADLLSLRVLGTGKALAEGAAVDAPVGQIVLDPDHYGPLVERLADGVDLGVADIETVHPHLERRDAVATLALLVEGGYALAAAGPWARADGVEAGRRLNRVLVEDGAAGHRRDRLVAPALGTAVGANYFDMLVLAARWEGVEAEPESIARGVLEEIQRQGRALLEDGRPVTDDARALRLATDEARAALGRLEGTLAALGVR